MKSLIFGAAVVLVMPYLTLLVLHHHVGEFATFVGMLAAGFCLIGSFALAQLASLATISLRLVRKLAGSKRSLEAPPTAGEKALFVGGPVLLALGVYSLTGLVLANWATEAPGRFIVLMVGLGIGYGSLMAWGLLGNLVDVHDTDALGVHPDSPADASPRQSQRPNGP